MKKVREESVDNIGQSPEDSCPEKVGLPFGKRTFVVDGFEMSAFRDTWMDSPWASLVPQMVKNLPVMQETWVPSLRWEDPLGKEMATHSSILMGNPMDRGAWWSTVHGVTKSWRLSN